ncbi:MAG TPA: type IV-A pilus assembly ATPase PilB [Candidatus Sumerlaeota bacterium]|nr:type IV-A pilus assembly ATPase PilB [Candidatus Sumerlaeota bacterium]
MSGDAEAMKSPEMRGKRERLGDLLLKKGAITSENLKTALSYQRSTKEKLGLILLEMGVTSEEDLAEALGFQFDLPFVMVSKEEVEPQALSIIPREVALKHQILPMRVQGNELTVAISDPSNVFLLDELRMLTQMRIHAVISFNTDITRALYRYYGVPLETPGSVDEILSQMDDGQVEVIQRYDDFDEDDEVDSSARVGDAPIIKLVNAIIFEAIRARASDIHVEPFDTTVRLRYRIDGVLQQRPDLPRSHQNAIISRIKILSGMDIAEKRLPQDGRFRVRSGGTSVDLRVNTVPTPSGEKVVLRLLDQSNLMVNLESLGFMSDDLARFQKEIHKPWGMCLVTGPTGSGKSTTLYSALSSLNTPGKNINTVEDPVEYRLPGIIQVAANENIGLSFASALRAFLRQDPDIIMVGEIRDLETAQVAVKAAQTGHMVFSTLHTNDASSAISRLSNMGVEPFLISGSLNMVVAQRLVRRICKHCKEFYEPSEQIYKDLGMDTEKMLPSLYRGVGCDACSMNGYKGRVALYEVLTVSDDMRDAIVEGSNSTAIKRQALKEGMRSLRGSGILKVIEGVTTADEVLASTVMDPL